MLQNPSSNSTTEMASLFDTTKVAIALFGHFAKSGLKISRENGYELGEDESSYRQFSLCYKIHS
jgi:hypothetical protein